MVVAAARRISVSIRKVLLDSNGAMVRRCILSPNMHPLVLASNSRPVIFPRHYDAQPVTLKSKYGAAQDVQVTVPAFDHITTIHPLYGIAHVGEDAFRMCCPFDYGAKPLKFSRWMNAKILEINGRQFSASEVLRELSDKEGAHIEHNPAAIFPDDSIPANGKSTLHRECDWVHFNELSYLHIFSIYTGLYVVNRTKPTLMKLPLTHDQTVQFMCRTISQCPWDLSCDDLKLRISNSLNLVFGDDNKLVQGYAEGVRTEFKIPSKPVTH